MRCGRSTGPPAADLDRSSLLVNLSVNRSERPQGQASTYLALLGLASSTDQNVFDRENRLFPRPRDPDAAEVLKESYIIFPTLTPFADPRLSSCRAFGLTLSNAALSASGAGAPRPISGAAPVQLHRCR